MPKISLKTCQAAADLTSYLQYIQQNEPLLTKKLRQINRKSVSEINALLVEPQQAIHDYGKLVFTDRDEQEFWKIRPKDGRGQKPIKFALIAKVSIANGAHLAEDDFDKF